MEELLEAVEVVNAVKEAKASYLVYRIALTNALAKRRDDRCVDGQAHLVLSTMYEEVAWSVLDGLLVIGTQPALAHAVEFIELDHKNGKERTKQRKKIAREKPVKKPRYWQGTSASWKSKEEARLAYTRTRFDVESEARQVWCEECAKRLRAFARSKSLATPPADTRWTTWDRWWRKARKSLPESLAG